MKLKHTINELSKNIKYLLKICWVFKSDSISTIEKYSYLKDPKYVNLQKHLT